MKTSTKSLAALLTLFANRPLPAAAASPPATKWQQTPKSLSRLITGSLPTPYGAPQLIVGVDIHVERGWKTYWRHPGDAGGVPPRLDWSKSQNLEKVNVLFPAPARITDASGILIGYEEHVILPVEVTASDPSRPIRLALALEFGVCSQICILAQAHHQLTIRTTKTFAMPPPLFQALERVPRPETALRPTDPRLVAVVAHLEGTSPHISIETAYPQETPKRADLFVETMNGSHLPMPRKIKSEKPGTARFEIKIPSDIDLRSLRGQELRLTLVSAAGASEFRRKIN